MFLACVPISHPDYHPYGASALHRRHLLRCTPHHAPGAHHPTILAPWPPHDTAALLRTWPRRESLDASRKFATSHGRSVRYDTGRCGWRVGRRSTHPARLGSRMAEVARHYHCWPIHWCRGWQGFGRVRGEGWSSQDRLIGARVEKASSTSGHCRHGDARASSIYYNCRRSCITLVPLEGQVNWDRFGRRWQQSVPIDSSPERVLPK